MGALVYANDVELGRTPLEANFTFYGKYDVRVELEGYEPLRTKAAADAPIYEIPPFDVVAMAIPADIETTVRWHFVLKPAEESGMDPRVAEDGLLTRAKELRGMLGEPAKAQTQPAGPPATQPQNAVPDAKPSDQDTAPTESKPGPAPR